MENKKLNIVILTYYFPPDQNIASRRWSKFAKYLVRNGHDVTVIASEPIHKNSPWDDDLKDLKIIRYKRNYPSILDTIPESFLQKVKYKLALRKLKKKVKGTIYDRAALLENQILFLTEKVIEENKAQVLIVNGPPHRIMYYGSLLKKKHKELFLVSDFRDPWTWWYNYGYPDLSKENLLIESDMEKSVVDYSDLLTVPANEMKSFLSKKYHGKEIFHLPHGVDTDDFSELLHAKRESKSELNRFVYFGTLYNGEESRFKSFAKFMSENLNITLHIYSDSRNYKDIFSSYNLNERVQYFDPIDSKILFSKLIDYDLFLLIYPDRFKNIFSSKFYEILYAGLPILLLSEKGEVSEFIESNNFGCLVTGNDGANLKNILSGKFCFSEITKDFIQKFSFSDLTNELETKIIHLLEKKEDEINR